MSTDNGERIEIDLPSGVTLEAFDWRPAPWVDPRPPWLLVHGLASNARLWDGVARRLVESGHHVVAVNQRGHGQSSKPRSGYDMATVADDLHQLIGELGWTRPAVAGQSWGGNVVVELAARHPDAVSHVVCVDGGFIDLRSRFPHWPDAAEAMAPPRLAGTPLAQITEWIESQAADWPEDGRRGTLANFEVRDDGTIAPWLSFDQHLEVLHGLWEHDVAAAYNTVEVPVLFVVAESGDVSWASAKHEQVANAIARLARARAVFDTAHHDIHAQKPDLVAGLLHRAVSDATFFDPDTDTDSDGDA